MAVLYNASWPYRYPITIDYTKVGASLTDYPLYLDGSDFPAQFFTDLGAVGGKVRFTNSLGTVEYPYEIVSYDDTAGTFEIHVKVDSVSSVSSTKIYAFVGNSGASAYGVGDTYGRNAVWSDYYMVFHMEDDVSGSATDSTGGGSDATNTNTSNATGVLGGGYSYNNSNSYNQVPNSTLMESMINDLTISVWLNPDILGDDDIVCVRGNGGNPQFIARINSSGKMTFTSATVAGGFDSAETTGTPVTTSWQLCHWRYDDSDLSLDFFHNGSLDTADSLAYELDTRPAGTVYMRIGANTYFANNNYFDGLMDEVRIRNGVLSDNWITTEYNNQNSPSTFYTVGARENNSATTASYKSFSAVV